MKVEWIDHGREAKNPPNPDFPDGVHADLAQGAISACDTLLPYPAPRCGLWLVTCEQCGSNAALTAAGRPDDPRSVHLPCKLGATGRMPEEKIRPDDEGELRVAFSRRSDGQVVIDFGKPVDMLSLHPEQAIAFGQALIEKARS